MLVDPGFLPGCAECHQHNVGAGGANLAEDLLFCILIEVAVLCADDIDARVMGIDPVPNRLRHPRTRAEQVETLLLLRHAGTQLGEQVGAVYIVAYRLLQHFAGDAHADAINKNPVHVGQILPVVCIGCGDIDAIGIDEGDAGWRLGHDGGINRRDRFVQRQVDQADAVDVEMGRYAYAVHFIDSSLTQ